MSRPDVALKKGKLVFQVATFDGKTLPSKRMYDFKCLTCQTKFALHQSTLYEAHLQENQCDGCGKVFACASRVRHHKTVKCNGGGQTGAVIKKKKKRGSKKNNWDGSSSEESGDFSDASDEVVEYLEIPTPAEPMLKLIEPPMRCKHCHLEFASREELHLHKVCRHCEHCLLTFECRSALQSHLSHCDRKPEPSAENDSSQLNTPAVAETDEPGPDFKCKSCECTFATELLLMMHVQIEMVQCSICRNNMHSGPEFLTHCAFRICTVCNVSFKCRERFDDHLTGGGGAACGADSQVIKCSYCCSAMVSDAEMGAHLAENTCHCGQRFSCRALKDTHRTLTHDGSEVKPKIAKVTAAAPYSFKEVCSFCKKGFHKKNDFHHRLRWCKFCGEQMPCCNVMVKHEKSCTHRPVRLYECDGCGDKFNTSNQLKRHLKRHCTAKVVPPVEPVRQPEVVAPPPPPKPWVYEEDFEMVPFNPFGDMYD